MKLLISAAAAWLAMTGTAYAQSAEAPKMACCEKMKEEGKKCCCEEMAEGDHAEHNMDGHTEDEGQQQ